MPVGPKSWRRQICCVFQNSKSGGTSFPGSHWATGGHAYYVAVKSYKFQHTSWTWRQITIDVTINYVKATVVLCHKLLEITLYNWIFPTAEMKRGCRHNAASAAEQTDHVTKWAIASLLTAVMGDIVAHWERWMGRVSAVHSQLMHGSPLRK